MREIKSINVKKLKLIKILIYFRLKNITVKFGEVNKIYYI